MAKMHEYFPFPVYSISTVFLELTHFLCEFVKSTAFTSRDPSSSEINKFDNILSQNQCQFHKGYASWVKYVYNVSVFFLSKTWNNPLNIVYPHGMYEIPHCYPHKDIWYTSTFQGPHTSPPLIPNEHLPSKEIQKCLIYW